MTALIESGARPYGSTKGVILSVALHAALIAAAIFGTAAVVLPPREKVEEHPILYVAPTPPPAVHIAPAPLPEVKVPPKAKAPAQPRQPQAPRPRPAQPQPRATTPALVAPTRVPLSLPAIDLKAPPTIGDIVAPPVRDRIDAGAISRSGSVRSGSGAAGGSESGRGLGSGSAGRAYSENQVERAVEVSNGVAPRYPDALRSVGVQGIVAMRFIVGADGRVEPGSIQVISSPHKLFSDAVRAALLNTRYRPAQVGGHAVRQLVEQSFSFRLAK